jgi:hypothetical protein
MRESWTDERLDELNGRVDKLGDRVDKLSDRVDRGFERLAGEMKAGFEDIHRQMSHASVVLGAALIGSIAAIVAKL